MLLASVIVASSTSGVVAMSRGATILRVSTISRVSVGVAGSVGVVHIEV